MERRVLLAVFLSFIVLYGYQSLFPSPTVPTNTEGPATVGAPEPAVSPSQVPALPPASTSGRRPAPVGLITAGEPPNPVPVIGDTQPKDIVVETDVFRAVFSNRGGELVSWQLKSYLERGAPVELIPTELPAEEPWPFSLLFEDEALTRLAHAALFRSSHNTLRLSDSVETLTFEYEDASGLSIRKRFTFDPAMSDYTMLVSIEARLNGGLLLPTIRWGPALGGVESTSQGYSFRQGPRGLINGRVLEAGVISDLEITRPDASDVAEQATYEGQLDFVGVDNHYFIAVALPGLEDAVVRYRAVPLQPRLPDGDPRELMAFDLTIPSGVTDLPFFIGPKDFDILAVAAPSLTGSIDFGFLALLVVPLHQSLKWVYSWVGNYGFAIIVVTLFVNVIIFPLRHKSVVSARKMQELQPEMKAIQERYAHLKATDPDKQKMNQEVMALYRDRGVNPVSGCLPMVLTMPILFAFYRLLSMAIEMRDAPFIGWITDLSVQDPYFVTPIIMGVSMVVQQRLNPMQGDPMQARMMQMMPVVFTFMFLWAPSGLVLYWLTSNLVGIGQQVLTNRIIGPPRVRTVRPPAERRIKQKKGKIRKNGGDHSGTK